MIDSFRASIANARDLLILFRHLVEELKLPGDYSDLLRMSLVYSMSALDKLVHDVIRHEMVETYAGARPPTPKYNSEPITMANHFELVDASRNQGSLPPAERVFEDLVRQKLAHRSFMDPTKLVDGLALVWAENQKWHVIAAQLGRDERHVRTELKNLFVRRNAIVHETDKDLSSGQKMPLTFRDAERAARFLSELGENIYALVVGV